MVQIYISLNYLALSTFDQEIYARENLFYNLSNDLDIFDISNKKISQILIESFPTIDWDRKKLNHIFNSKEYKSANKTSVEFIINKYASYILNSIIQDSNKNIIKPSENFIFLPWLYNLPE